MYSIVGEATMLQCIPHTVLSMFRQQIWSAAKDRLCLSTQNYTNFQHVKLLSSHNLVSGSQYCWQDGYMKNILGIWLHTFFEGFVEPIHHVNGGTEVKLVIRVFASLSWVQL